MLSRKDTSWSESEDKKLLENLDKNPVELAEIFGRTKHAIYARKTILRKRANQPKVESVYHDGSIDDIDWQKIQNEQRIKEITNEYFPGQEFARKSFMKPQKDFARDLFSEGFGNSSIKERGIVITYKGARITLDENVKEVTIKGDEIVIN